MLGTCLRMLEASGRLFDSAIDSCGGNDAAKNARFTKTYFDYLFEVLVLFAALDAEDLRVALFEHQQPNSALCAVHALNYILQGKFPSFNRFKEVSTEVCM